MQRRGPKTVRQRGDNLRGPRRLAVADLVRLISSGAGSATRHTRLHRLRLREPAQELVIEVLDGVNRDMMTHAVRSDLLDSRYALRADLMISDEAHAKMVPPHRHAPKVVSADQVDARPHGVHTQGSGPRQSSAEGLEEHAQRGILASKVISDANGSARVPLVLLRELSSTDSAGPEGPSLSRTCPPHSEVSRQHATMVNGPLGDIPQLERRRGRVFAWWTLISQPRTRPACSIHLRIMGPCASSNVFTLT